MGQPFLVTLADRDGAVVAAAEIPESLTDLASLRDRLAVAAREYVVSHTAQLSRYGRKVALHLASEYQVGIVRAAALVTAHSDEVRMADRLLSLPYYPADRIAEREGLAPTPEGDGQPEPSDDDSAEAGR